MTVCQCVTECVQTWRRCGCVLWLHGESGFLSENKAGNVAWAVSRAIKASAKLSLPSQLPVWAAAAARFFLRFPVFKNISFAESSRWGNSSLKNTVGQTDLQYVIRAICQRKWKRIKRNRTQQATLSQTVLASLSSNGYCDYPPQGPEPTARRHRNVFRQIQGLPGLPECVGARQPEKEAAFCMNLLP